MQPSEHMRPTKSAKYAYSGERYDFIAIISVSLLVVKRDRKKMTGTRNHIIVRIGDDMNYVLSLSCLYESELLIWAR